MIGRPVWLPAVKFDSCNTLLSCDHTDCITLRSVRLCINRKYHLRYFEIYVDSHPAVSAMLSNKLTPCCV